MALAYLRPVTAVLFPPECTHDDSRQAVRLLLFQIPGRQDMGFDLEQCRQPESLLCIHRSRIFCKL